MDYISKKGGWVLILVFFSAFMMNQIAAENRVALCITATGKYDVFANQLIRSARQFFLTDKQVNYFVFTDGVVEEAEDVVIVHQPRLGWPYDTMMRFEIYLNHKELFKDFDYVFAVDADMLFVDYIGEEILGDLVGTIHPGFYNSRGTYETRRKSKACVRPREGEYYFAGGFYGGKRENFILLLKETSKNIREDLKRNIIAIWHDESHLNRYFIDHPPTVKLSPSYCYPESWSLPFSKKLLALDKNHSELRK